MTQYVLDASVAVKWFLLPPMEALTAEALELLHAFETGRIRLTVPDLFWPEIGSVFWKAVRQGRISLAAAHDAIRSVRELHIPTLPCAALLEDAFTTATRSGQTVYDCIYVALAAASGVPLLTADERLVNTLGSRFPIRWLGSTEIS